MATELKALWRDFRPSSPVLLHVDRIEIPPKSGRQVALSRALTPYRRLTLPAGVPSDKRLNALRLQALEWAPYTRPGMMFDLSDDGAGVWTWDSDRVERTITEAGLNPAQLRLVPETALHRPLIEGLRLVTCLDGVEGQVWRDRRLMASRWWPATPPDDDWMRFQRAAGLNPREVSSDPPLLLSEGWLRNPWPRRGSVWSAKSMPAGQLAAAAAVILLAVTAYQVGEVTRLSRVAAAASKANAALVATAKPLEVARAQTLDANARAQAIFALESRDNQLALMARVAEQLPPNGTTLTSWIYQDSDLTITMSSPAQPLDSSFLIRKLEGVGNFTVSQVDPSADGKSLLVRIKVKPK